MALNQVETGRMRAREASELLGLCLRHVRRILAAYRKEGAAALAHGNRKRKPHNALDANLKRRARKLARITYASCNHQHFTDCHALLAVTLLLVEREGITLSRSSV